MVETTVIINLLQIFQQSTDLCWTKVDLDETNSLRKIDLRTQKITIEMGISSILFLNYLLYRGIHQIKTKGGL